MRGVHPTWLKGVRRRHDAVRLPGLRRVGWITITTTADGSVDCRAYGVGNRRPVSQPVTLSTALELKTRGVPTVIRRGDTTDNQPSSAPAAT
jgi:hypothetical protein